MGFFDKFRRNTKSQVPNKLINIDTLIIDLFVSIYLPYTQVFNEIKILWVQLNDDKDINYVNKRIEEIRERSKKIKIDSQKDMTDEEKRINKVLKNLVKKDKISEEDWNVDIDLDKNVIKEMHGDGEDVWKVSKAGKDNLGQGIKIVRMHL